LAVSLTGADPAVVAEPEPALVPGLAATPVDSAPPVDVARAIEAGIAAAAAQQAAARIRRPGETRIVPCRDVGPTQTFPGGGALPAGVRAGEQPS
jgi:hypothetical protein